LTQLQKVVGSTTYIVGYQYNLAGETTKITYPSGRAINQNVDAIGRLSSIVGTLNNVNNTYASGFAYNPAFQTTGFQYGNNVYASFGFSADRLQLNCLDYATTNRSGTCAHDATSKFGLGYTYGSAGSNDGQISGVTDSVDNGRSATYSYDALYRLTSAVTTGSTGYPKWGLSMTYDRYGNRTAQNITAGTNMPSSCLAVSAATNRVTGTCSSSTGFSSDLSGNMTGDGVNTLIYDAENRLVSSTNGSTSGSYTYDGRGLRVKRISGSTTTVTIFSGDLDIAEYVNGAAPSSPSYEYFYAGSQKIASIQSGTTYYFHNDHLSLRIRTNASGGVVDQRGHYPFGESWYSPSGASSIFTTYHRDSESGNDYAMARFNASRLGRFLSADPLAGNIVDPQSLNRFSYTRNDPVNLTDPFGLFVAPQLYAAMRAAGASMAGSFWNANEFALMDVQRIGTMYHFEFDAGYTPFGGWNISSLLRDADYGEGGVTYTTSPIYGGLPPIFAAKPNQKLTFKTVRGGASSKTWVVQWKLSNESKSGGWIVQNVTINDASGKQTYNYWEAWQIPAGSQITNYAITGDINDDEFVGASGSKFNAEARFYEGLQLPSSFQPNNPATAAGILPSTTVNPKLPTDNATEPVDRTWTAP